jgi:hypothetical protein
MGYTAHQKRVYRLGWDLDARLPDLGKMISFDACQDLTDQAFAFWYNVPLKEIKKNKSRPIVLGKKSGRIAFAHKSTILSIPPFSKNGVYMLHEIAHSILHTSCTKEWYSEDNGHGGAFVSVMARLWAKFSTADDRIAMRNYLTKKGLETPKQKNLLPKHMFAMIKTLADSENVEMKAKDYVSRNVEDLNKIDWAKNEESTKSIMALIMQYGIKSVSRKTAGGSNFKALDKWTIEKYRTHCGCKNTGSFAKGNATVCRDHIDEGLGRRYAA